MLYLTWSRFVSEKVLDAKKKKSQHFTTRLFASRTHLSNSAKNSSLELAGNNVVGKDAMLSLTHTRI